MAKSNFFKSKTKKSVIALLAATAVTCTGLAAACAKKSDENKPTALRTKQEDTQLLKNGNFEFFDYPSDEYLNDGKALYLIKTPDNWSRSGDSSNAMSGVIGTSSRSWAQLTSTELKSKLEYNADLSSSDDGYVDYNGMKARDLLYKDTYAALLEASAVADSYIKNQGYYDYFGIEEKDGKFYYAGREVKKGAEEGDEDYYFVNEDGTLGECIRNAFIANPGTHLTEAELEKLYKGDDDEYYFDEEHKYSATNVLMVHNYPTNSYYNGISQYYSSQTLTLEAHTAAEISLWVKTSDLKFDKGYSQINDQDRGAFIEVAQTVSGTTVDSFKIKSINTEKIIKDNPGFNTNNGWLQYTVYINACDFADSTVQIKLGLGQNENSEKCTGYAFFDDVKVTKYVDFDDENSTFDESKVSEYPTCTLTSEEDEKIFIADTDDRYHGGDKTSEDYLRYSKNFSYYIDLASETSITGDTATGYAPYAFGTSNVTAALTTEKADGKLYASAEELKASVTGINKVTKNGDKNYDLHKLLKAGIVTDGDILGAFGKDGIPDSLSTIYKKKLNDALTGENGIEHLPGYNAENSNMLVMLSAQGAAYTSAIEDSGKFTLDKDNKYMLVSFWVKTSEMKSGTAATVKITDANDEKNSSSFSVDTTNVKTDFEGKEDIYNGWVQCFIFVANEADGDADKTFKIDFMFGNTTIAGKSASAYDYGWIAMANMQTLEINEDIYKLANAGSYSVKFSFGDEDENKKDVPFTESSLISDITAGFADPADYTGVNGVSFDGKNSNSFAGLINRDEFDNYDTDLQNQILTGFVTSAANWNDVFGEDCYQPLIIGANLRKYAENAKANEDNYKDYLVLAEDGEDATYTDIYGKRYREVKADEDFDEDTTYYSKKEVVNYGFIGGSKSVSSNSYETVSIKVKAGKGATAYIYLVDPATREVLKYSTPEKTYFYDPEGNVLNAEYSDDWTDDEHRAAIVYKLRKDGLYDSADSSDKKVYANVYNLIKSYNYPKYESNTFYDGNGNSVTFDNLAEGKTYYSDKEHTKVADHFLCTANGKRVYEVKDGKYYYLGAVKEIEVTPFADGIPQRYKQASDSLYYMVKVEGGENGTDWVTVNFVIHTGSKSLDYRVEVWNGDRNSTGVDKSGNPTTTGTVAFDYSAYSVSSGNYEDLLGEYENKIINEYKQFLKDKNLLGEIDPDKDGIAYFESLINSLIAEGKLKTNDFDKADLAEKYWMQSLYYTYTLYDSDTFEPYNENTAVDGETGYDYTITDFEETLAFFTYKNEVSYEDGKKDISYNVFVDYSAIDQSIEKATVDDGGDDPTPDDNDSVDWWLYVSSIVLVVALLITLVSLLLREFFKKNKHKKSEKALQKNNYRQRKRYIRKLHLTENSEEPEDNANDEPVEEQPTEEAPAEQPADGDGETPDGNE